MFRIKDRSHTARVKEKAHNNTIEKKSFYEIVFWVCSVICIPFPINNSTRKSRLTKIGRKTGIWKIGKKPISENTKNFEIKIFLWIEESITNNYRYIRSSYLEIDPILSEPVGMIISFITDGIHYYIKFWSQNFSPLPTFHRTYTKSSSILLITP